MGTTKGTWNELKSLISGTYRFKTEERWRTNERRRKIFTKWTTETFRTRYGSASAWIFFTETIFFTNFKWSTDTRRVERFCSSLLSVFIGKRGRSLPPNSPWRARLLPLAQVGMVAIWTPLFTKYTPTFFCWFFFRNVMELYEFRNVMELYEFRNDTCFPSVMLPNLTD